MKRILIFLVVVTVVLSSTAGLSSRKPKIWCCRPVCTCNPKVVTCDRKTFEECHELRGWEVIDCSDCRARTERE